MRIYHEASFGPVAVVVRAKGEDEAVASPMTLPMGSRRRFLAVTSIGPSGWRGATE
jgi:hypothetical protein